MLKRFLGLLSRQRGRGYGQKPPVQSQIRLVLEMLETRDLPSTISGYVFHDLNNNGLREAQEPGLAGVTLELRNAAGQIIATTTSGANGYYVFDRDLTIPQTEQVLTRVVSFPETRTNTSLSQMVSQFDPNLGRLTAIEIIVQGRIATTIQVENLDPAPATITATFSGSLTLTGPGLSTTVTTSSDSLTHNAAAYDGFSDFTGPSGTTFGPRTVSGSRTVILTDASTLQAWTGTGTVTLSSLGRTNSSATGGNLLAQISGLAGAEVTIRYRYIPSNALRPGNYTIRQLQQPTGYLDGLESQGNTIIPGSIGNDIIPVALQHQQPSTDNNFAEILPSRIQGFVYHDKNANGLRDPDEPGISGAVVILAGTDDRGQTIQWQVSTTNDGSFQFTNLRPGIYNLQQIQPNDYWDGRESIQPLSNGTAETNLPRVGPDIFSSIVVDQGRTYGYYNFGEVVPASIQGSVFQDDNLNSVRDAQEVGIPGVTIRLVGLDDLGNSVQLSTTTDETGKFQFSDLRPGTYTLIQAQPAGYLDGGVQTGSAGGSPGNNSIGSIVLISAAHAIGYDFAEVRPATLGGWVYHDANNDGRRDPGERGISEVLIVVTGADYRGRPVEISGRTDASGRFLFSGLAPGTYTLYQVQPAGYLNGKLSASVAGGGLVQANSFTGLHLQPGTIAADYLFGELLPGSISGYVYLDLSRNGVRDSGDRGLAGVTITLTGTNDLGQSIRLTTQTAADGSYQFRNLRPGVYALYQSQPAGYEEGAITVGSLGGQKSGINLITNIRLRSGQYGTNYNFGENEPIKPNDRSPPSLPSKRSFLASRRLR
ncbi:MAG: SdrD B-like domain-containing protein [Gemmatales bacterium]|nr:carboxypeptidase regulatory-like domain-containing protein [Gemmatales bacterium]MDW7993459.1 SdrD B-like domain-containing protein [Gemmatales bacterium]